MADDRPESLKPPTYEYAKKEGKRVQGEIGKEARIGKDYKQYSDERIASYKEEQKRAPENIHWLRKQNEHAQRMAKGYKRASKESGVPELKSSQRKR